MKKSSSSNKTSKCISVLQWNSRSISTNYASFENHISTTDYSVLALQSLNVTRKKLPKLKNFFYPPIHSCSPTTNKVQAALYINKSLEYFVINDKDFTSDNDNICIAGASVKFDSSNIVNILSVYLPAGPKENNTDWLKTIDMKKKWMILGDFNAHSPMWDISGPSVTSSRLVENILDSNLVLLNDGSITRIPDISSHRASAIDLSLVSPNLAINCSWETSDDCLGSDHIPINILVNDIKIDECQVTEDIIPNFHHERANWPLFQSTLLGLDYNNIQNDDVEVFYSNFKNGLIFAAEQSIPRCNNNAHRKHSGNPWWNTDCEAAVIAKKSAYKRWIRSKSDDNFNAMKREKINCKRIIAAAKKSHWEEFCKQEVRESKDIHKVWKKVKRLKSSFDLQQFPITTDKNSFPSPKEKAEAFAEVFAKNSSSSSLDPSILKYRTEEEKKSEYDDPVADDKHYLNARLGLEEVTDALKTFSSKNSAVGLDGISYQMLTHMPDTWINLLHSLFQICWLSGTLPSLWKQSVVIPIHKQGKPRDSINSYRPIALTSNVCKVFEKVILSRLQYFCDRNNIIPIQQAGFRKGRCTTDHLVKLSNQIKKQFAKRKSVLATFFDVKKAYDSVWHAKLLSKLKSVGINGCTFHCVKSFLENRYICTRIGRTYSTFKKTDMGLPQGSLLSPLLFSLLIFDLPSSLSNNISVAQYADDIAIWMNTGLRKHTPKRAIDHVRKIYQNDLDSLYLYLLDNGLELSGEKTSLILFNNGENPKDLPRFHLKGAPLNYSQCVKFLGVYFTPKLTWKTHIEYLLTKARKRINLLKIITSMPWSQNVVSMVHLSIALIRSTLSYGQEVYFSASKTLLNKLQSLDSKAIKFAIGVPIHTSSTKTYRETGILSLTENRLLATSRYVVRSLSVQNSTSSEIFIDSINDFPKRARSISYIQPIGNYVKDFMEKNNVDMKQIKISPTVPIIPPWEHLKGHFDMDYCHLKKSDDPFFLASVVKEKIACQYYYHLKVYTDGSVVESGDSGCGFYIPSLGIKKFYHLGKYFSIFTAELLAIMMALTFIQDLHIDIYQIVVFIDSESVLSSLNNCSVNTRSDLLFDIRYLTHCLISRGIDVNFMWIPSHIGIKGNDVADNLAHSGAVNIPGSIQFDSLPLSTHELFAQLTKDLSKKPNLNLNNLNSYSRHISSVLLKLRLNSWKTKFSKINCLCQLAHFNIDHALFDCPITKLSFLRSGIKIPDKEQDRREFLYNANAISIAKVISTSAIRNLI